MQKMTRGAKGHTKHLRRRIYLVIVGDVHLVFPAKIHLAGASALPTTLLADVPSARFDVSRYLFPVAGIEVICHGRLRQMLYLLMYLLILYKTQYLHVNRLRIQPKPRIRAGSSRLSPYLLTSLPGRLTLAHRTSVPVTAKCTPSMKGESPTMPGSNAKTNLSLREHLLSLTSEERRQILQWLRAEARRLGCRVNRNTLAQDQFLEIQPDLSVYRSLN